MTITKHFLVLFIMVSFFVFTFFDTSGGYFFFVYAFPISLILTCVVFIEELFNPSRKPKYIDETEKLSDGMGMKGLVGSLVSIGFITALAVLYKHTSSDAVKGLSLVGGAATAYFCYKLFQRFSYGNMKLSVRRRITPVNLLLLSVFFFVFGMYYFKAIYIPNSADAIIRKNEYQFLTDTAYRYSAIDSILKGTKDTVYTAENLDTLEPLYTAYFEKLGGAKLTRDNIKDYPVLDWSDEACQKGYYKMLTHSYESNLKDGILTIKFNTFFYGLSGNIYRDLETYKGQYSKLVYDLTDCSGGSLEQAIYATDPIFPINIVAKVKTNPERKGINTQVFSSTDYLVDAEIEMTYSKATSNLGLWALKNGEALQYPSVEFPLEDLSPNTSNLIYSVFYVSEVDSYYVFPVGELEAMH